MKTLGIILGLFFVASAQAAELTWDQQTITSPLTVERSATQAGPFSAVATLPTGATSYILTPGAYGWYRVSNSAGPSNSVLFSADLYTGLVTDRLDALETRVTALESAPVVTTPPAPTGNISARQVDSDRIEVVGTNCTSLRTTGSGLRRIVECVH